MPDKTIDTLKPQTNDGAFDLALRQTQSLAGLHDRLASGSATFLASGSAANGSGLLLAANPARRKFWIQNRSTSTLTVLLGAAAVQLRGCDLAGDGSGGFLCDSDWKGAVSLSGSNLNYNFGEI